MTYKNPNPKLSDLVSIPNLEKRIREGYISVSTTGTLRLYCYSKTAQYEQMWDNETRTCRGLIVDKNDRVIGRPFPKFFNYGQVPLPDWCDFPPIVTEKVDGSLGICFWDEGMQRWRIATKGSFSSDQAVRANLLLKCSCGGSETDPHSFGGPGTTTLFEIIYPENRIVVDYGNSSFLHMLATIKNRTGEDVLGAKLPVRWDLLTDGEIETLAKSPMFDYKEGLVAAWKNPNGGPAFRMKFKNGRYLRLHSLMTKMTARKIWAVLKEEGTTGMDELLKEAPDEFQEWALTVVGRLWFDREAIHRKARTDCLAVLRTTGMEGFGGTVPTHEQRKSFAAATQRYSNRHLLFKLLDGRSIEEDVWNLVYPAHETPFMQTDD